MKSNNIDIKSIEEIALEYLRFNKNKIIKMGFSTDTTVDTGTYEKECLNKNKEYFSQIENSLNFNPSTYTKGKILYEENEKVDVNFYKLPQKDLGEEEECTYSYSGFISPVNISPISTKNIVENYTAVIELRSVNKVKGNSKIFFPFNYANVYEGITELYHPLLNNLETINSIKSLLSNSIINLDNFFNHDSIFETTKKININLAKFLEDQKIFEYLEFNQILMLFQIIDNESTENYLTEFDDEKIYTLYQNSVLILQKLYTNLMLELLINNFINGNKQNTSYSNIANLNIITCLNNGNNFSNTNKNSVRKKEINTKKQMSFENICFNYVQNFFKNTNRLTIEQAITTLNENLEEILRCLFINNEVFLLVFKNIDLNKYFKDNLNTTKNKMNTIGKNPTTTDSTGINNEIIVNNLEDFQERYSYFQKLREYFSEKDIEQNNNNTITTNLSKNNNKKSNEKQNSNTTKPKNKSKQKNKSNTTLSSGNSINSLQTINNNSTKNNINTPHLNENYSKIKNITKPYFNTLKELITKNLITIPYLPPINKKQYTLVLDLDETLVHYVEDEEHPFVQVRPYAAYFLEQMGKYFEIVIFTAAAEDYADLVLDELDKNNSISYRLYRRHTKPNKGAFLKDLSKLGRDITKTCIIDNNKDNFELQPQNGLHISTFIGEQNDNELLLLCNDLMKIVKSNKKDIRPIIKEINDAMNKRYLQDGSSFVDN